MINNIQVLRAFAALSVVLFHVIGTSVSYGHGVFLFAPLQGWGQNGVDVFFVISGFVMVYTQGVNPKPAAVFIKNRVLRIVPLYWFFTLCLLLLCLLAPSMFRELRPTLAHVVWSFLTITHITAEKYPLVYVGWTLEYEMLFYILFGLGLLLQKPALSFAVVIVTLLLLVVTGFADAIILEFAFGMFCAKVYLASKGRAFGWAALGVGTLLLAASIVTRTDLHRAIVWGVPSFLIVFGSLYVRQIREGLLVYLGAASYSIYLVQVFSVAAFYKLSSAFLTFVPPDLLAIVAVAFTAALGCATYELIEKPLGRILGRSRKHSGRESIQLGTSEHPAEEVRG
jgi:peptidoglycan/LPS O-acetylase OafA/YrhL